MFSVIHNNYSFNLANIYEFKNVRYSPVSSIFVRMNSIRGKLICGWFIC